MKKHKELIEQILKENDGLLTTQQITRFKIPRRCLHEMTEAGTIYRIARGIYALPDAWNDEMFILQHQFSKGIISHESALYLHSMCDRTPIKFTLTFPKGYHCEGIQKQDLIAKYTSSKTYELGITSIMSPCNNLIKVYDIERTLCDIIKTRHAADIQIITQAMKNYVSSEHKDIAKLLDFAEIMGVKQKILKYMEVLL